MTETEASQLRPGDLIERNDSVDWRIGIITRYRPDALLVRWPQGTYWQSRESLLHFHCVSYDEFLPGPGDPLYLPR